MAERTIVGVDFSGRESGNTTWATMAVLQETTFTIQSCAKMGNSREAAHSQLKQQLKYLSPGSIAAMDFPFGVPKGFLAHLNLTATTMNEVWPHLAGLGLEGFHNSRNELVAERRRKQLKLLELKRTGDAADYPESISPLNLRMRPMTYHGICVLHSLHQESPGRWLVPPLDCDEGVEERVTLLEVMPGAFLKSIGFSQETIKNYKGERNLLNRKYIVNNLSDFSKVEMSNLDEFRRICLDNDDALDSVVAAIAAAMWSKDKTLFHRPEDNPDPAVLKDAQLEGWIYAPKK